MITPLTIATRIQALDAFNSELQKPLEADVDLEKFILDFRVQLRKNALELLRAEKRNLHALGSEFIKKLLKSDEPWASIALNMMQQEALGAVEWDFDQVITFATTMNTSIKARKTIKGKKGLKNTATDVYLTAQKPQNLAKMRRS